MRVFSALFSVPSRNPTASEPQPTPPPPLPRRIVIPTRETASAIMYVRTGPTVVLGVALKLEDNSSVFRLGGAVDEYSIQRRPRNTETNVRFTQQQQQQRFVLKYWCISPGFDVHPLVCPWLNREDIEYDAL